MVMPRLRQAYVYGGIAFRCLEEIRDFLEILRVQILNDKGPHWMCSKSIVIKLVELVEDVASHVTVKLAYSEHNNPNLKPVCQELECLVKRLNQIVNEEPFFQTRRFLGDRLWYKFSEGRTPSLSRADGAVAFSNLVLAQAHASELLAKATFAVPPEILAP